MPDEKKNKRPTAEQQLERDPVFQQKMAERAKAVCEAIYGNMMPILKGVVKKKVRIGTAASGYHIEEINIEPDERVRAGKLLKETFVDKRMADKRDSGNEKGKGTGTNHEKALKEAEEKILRSKNRLSAKKREPAPEDALRSFPATIHDFDKKGPVGNA